MTDPTKRSAWTVTDDAALVFSQMTAAQRDAQVRRWVDHGGRRITRWYRAMAAPGVKRRLEALSGPPRET
jgi:hypothetical protein